MNHLFVVRHGEIDFNTEGRYTGSIDVKLNNKGLQQAYDIANEIFGLNIDIVITSPLKRCRQTTDIIHEVINASIVVMDEFRERGVGVFEGLTKEEAEKKYPNLWVKNITRIYNNAPPGGETIKEVEDRVFTGLKKIKAEYFDRNILIVTHAFIGKVIHKIFHKMTEEKFFEYKLENAQIVKYDLQD